MAYSGRLNKTLVRMNDGDEYRFVEEVRAVRKENDNQPLLGFLLLALTGPTVIPMLLGWAMSILVMLGTLALPMEGLALATLDLENLLEMRISTSTSKWTSVRMAQKWRPWGP